MEMRKRLNGITNKFNFKAVAAMMMPIPTMKNRMINRTIPLVLFGISLGGIPAQAGGMDPAGALGLSTSAAGYPEIPLTATTTIGVMERREEEKENQAAIQYTREIVVEATQGDGVDLEFLLPQLREDPKLSTLTLEQLCQVIVDANAKHMFSPSGADQPEIPWDQARDIIRRVLLNNQR